MRRYRAHFPSAGLELFFDDGFVCDELSIGQRPQGAQQHEEMLRNISLLSDLVSKYEQFGNREIRRLMSQRSIDWREMNAMLMAFMTGESYRMLTKASAIRVGLYEFQIGIRFENEYDPTHFTFSYMTVPLGLTTGTIILRDLNRPDQKAIISWEKGMIKKAGDLSEATD